METGAFTLGRLGAQIDFSATTPVVTIFVSSHSSGCERSAGSGDEPAVLEAGFEDSMIPEARRAQCVREWFAIWAELG